MANIKVKGVSIASVDVEDNVHSNGKLSVPLLLSFPHSGESYPDDFGTNPELPFEILDFPNDRYVNELYRSRKELGVSQPAVSQLIKKLEDAVGVPLFVRRNGLIPAPEEIFIIEPPLFFLSMGITSFVK